VGLGGGCFRSAPAGLVELLTTLYMSVNGHGGLMRLNAYGYGITVYGMHIVGMMPGDCTLHGV